MIGRCVLNGCLHGLLLLGLSACGIYDAPGRAADRGAAVEVYRPLASGRHASDAVEAPAWLGIEQSPGLTDLLAKADRYISQQSYDQAAQSVERALRLQPYSVNALEKLAQIRFAQQDYPAAEQLARRALSLVPDLGPSAKARRASLQALISQIRAATPSP